MTSEVRDEAFVWVWLPGATQPVVAGRLSRAGPTLVFNYGRLYLARKDAIALYEPELPLRPGVLALPSGLAMPSAIRDAAPDAWGRRVIINRVLGGAGRDADTAELDELTYLLESGSDRSGALDFQRSATLYVPRADGGASLGDLMNAAALVEAGMPLEPQLQLALLHGSSMGGARPKAMITEGDTRYIAKFSAQNDLYSVVKAEFIAMRLATLAGLDVAPVKLQRAAGKDVLLVKRFDRVAGPAGWQRKAMVSGLTLLALDEMMARYASYEDLAVLMRQRFANFSTGLPELFGRLVFNILVGNTDDHARNHAAFWNGSDLALTPAYDICPQPRAGNVAGQAMLILGGRNDSRLALCLKASRTFLLSPQKAVAIIAHQITVIREHWEHVCDEAGLSPIDRALFWRRQVLNPFAFEGAPAELAGLMG